MGKNKARSTVMSRRRQVLISDELKERLAKTAQAAGVSRATWVRAAIAGALDRSGVDPLDRLQSLHAPTAAIHRMNREIAKGRR